MIQPLLRDDYTGLPPTFLMTAGFDPRRDDNRMFVDRLTAADAFRVSKAILMILS